MDDLVALERWIAPLLEQLRPAARRALARKIGTELRRSQQQRIAAQQDPEGRAFEARKRPIKARTQARGARVKTGPMFRKLRTANHLRIRAYESEVAVGFIGRVARIAQVHHHGLDDAARPGGTRVHYARRQLLGFTKADRDRMRELLIEHLTG